MRLNKTPIIGLMAMATLSASVTCATAFAATSLAMTSSATTSSQQWQPVSAESLMELPANLIEKRIQQDFNMSPMASELLGLEQAIGEQSSQIKAVQELVSDAPANEMIDEKVSLVQLKSNFLDDMQLGHKLRQDALNQKIDVYQDVLEKMYQASNRQQNEAKFVLKQQQEAARQRMEKVMAQVDETISAQGYTSQSPYADEFAKNLAKIEQLKEAISNHQASMAAKVDGIEVSTEEYIRQLLIQASSEQSLLDQEGLMLSYMSKLVALDAQSLEYAISDQQAGDDVLAQPMTTPAKSVDLFL
jgi:methylphosphotriester-DNA--protein-cysteine methyltransferase